MSADTPPSVPAPARIAPPWLLFLGAAANREEIKTALGMARWRPENCLGEYALPGIAAGVTTGLPVRTPAEAAAAGARTMVLGGVNAGGRLSADWIDAIHGALAAGLDVASGMHQRLHDVAELRAAAEAAGRTLHDVRTPARDIPVGRGARRPGRRVLTVGTDCNLGKMWTALALEEEFRRRGVPATFRATGQTGILIQGEGVPVDAVVSDFLSGSVEQLCPGNAPDHWDVVEGQGSLFHPSFAAVSLGLLHGAAPDAMVLCHKPDRQHVRGLPDYPLPDLDECIAANESAARLTNPRAHVVGIALNTWGLEDAAATEICEKTASREFGRPGRRLPVTDPIRHGAGPLVDACLRHVGA